MRAALLRAFRTYRSLRASAHGPLAALRIAFRHHIRRLP